MNSTKLKKILIYITITILSTSQVESRVFATGENLPLEAQIQESQEITEAISQENPLSNSQEISINEEISNEEKNTDKREENQTVNEEKEEKSESDEEISSELQQNAPLETDTETEDKDSEISGEELNQTLNEEQNKDNNEESKENEESNEKQETTSQEESPQIVFPQPKLSSLKAPRLLGATPNSSQTFTLSFDSQCEEEIESVELPAGTSLSEHRPEDPYFENHMLLGWFDENGERFRWDEATIENDLHLTAHWAEFEDITYTGLYDEAIVSYTIMDRNLGATSLDLDSHDSYGYFYQWGNNHGFYEDHSLNTTTGTKVTITDDKPYYSETYIHDSSSRFNGSHPNLRGGAEDAPINYYDDANERLLRQGPCPRGYHVPSIEELYVFTMLYFSNEGIVQNPSLFENIAGLGRKSNISFKNLENLQKFNNLFHLPLAGRISGAGVRDRGVNDTAQIQTFLMSSTPKNGKDLLFETSIKLTDNTIYANIGGWENITSIAAPMRCFKDEELLNVEWKNDDGTIIEKDIDLDFGIMPEYNGPTPTKAPDRNYTYTFSGWNKAIGPLKRNMVFRATYTPHERIGYLVTFSGTDLENTFVTEGEKVEKPEDPTKIDSIFKGWYADAEYSQTFDFSSPITKDTVIYAKWEKKKYTITRKNADGTVLETDTNVPYGSNPQYNGQTPSKTKDQQYTYTFSGRSPTITEVTANQTYTATFKTTTNQYSITFKDENGTVLKSATQYPYGTMIDTINIPTPPTKRGFTFMGRNPVLGTVTQDRTYTAVYQIQNYTITYKVDGKIYATEQHTYGENITLKPEPTKEGYTFSHWNRNLPATMPDEDITIEGTFTPITYHITYQLNSGTNHIDNPDTYTIETPTFPLKSPMREGYSFKGRKEGNQILTQIVKGTKGDKNLTATREANKVHIILDEQGGTGGTSDFWYYFGTQKYYQDEACTQELQKIVKPTKAGYTFQDYFSETIGERFGVYRKDGQRIELDTPEEDTYYRISSEHTLKARREANTIKISLDKNGGTGGTDALRYRYDTPIFYRDEAMTQRISKIIRPTRKGYLFQDYYSEEKGERYLAYEGTDGTIVEIADDLHTDISTNHTLKARRNPKIIHITLDKQGGTGGTSDFYFSFDTKKYYTDENLTQELKKIVKPTKEGYTFQDYFSEEIGERFVAYQNGNKRIELDTPEEDTYYKIANDLTLKARRKEKENEKPQPTHSSGGGSSGGRLLKDRCPNGDFSDSYYDRKCGEDPKKEKKSDQTHGSAEYSEEEMDIFEWALKNGLTSMTTLEAFDGKRALKRSEMAKIISIFSTKFMDKKEEKNPDCENFEDIKNITSDLHDYMIEACNLGIMGRTSDGKGVMKNFRPLDEVTKAEAVTIVSRVFRNHQYHNVNGEKRYEGHLKHLIEIGALEDKKNIDNPFSRNHFYQLFKKIYTLDL